MIFTKHRLIEVEASLASDLGAAGLTYFLPVPPRGFLTRLDISAVSEESTVDAVMILSDPIFYRAPGVIFNDPDYDEGVIDEGSLTVVPDPIDSGLNVSLFQPWELLEVGGEIGGGTPVGFIGSPYASGFPGMMKVPYQLHITDPNLPYAFVMLVLPQAGAGTRLYRVTWEVLGIRVPE